MSFTHMCEQKRRRFIHNENTPILKKDKVVVIYTAAGTHPILKCLFTRQPFTMPKALYKRLPCIQYKIVIYTSAVYHVKRVIYTAAVHPV